MGIWGKNENNMFDRIDQIETAETISMGLDNITILGQVNSDFENPEEEIFEDILDTEEDLIAEVVTEERNILADEPIETRMGYQGRNYDPDYHKKKLNRSPVGNTSGGPKGY